jgi:copper chaperone
MSIFQINDMTCGHCASTIAKALADTDKNAKVDIDIGARQVEVSHAEVDEAQLQMAITQAGYTPVLVRSTTDNPEAAVRPKRGGCGCGCG